MGRLKIDTLLCTAGEKTKQQREETAQALEEFGKFFPVNFNRNMTRKMSLLSIEAPKPVREDGDFFKYLKLEQEIERAHNVLYTLERQFECVKNKVEKFYLMIRGYKNLQKCGKDITSLRKPMNKKSKSNLKLERISVSKLEVHFFVLLYFLCFYV